MPRPRVAYRKRALPAGVREAVTALALEGVPTREIATRYGVDPETVRSLAATVGGLDPQHVLTLRRGLGSLLTVLAATHGAESLALAHEDPGTAAKSMFASKLAVDAMKNLGHDTDQPGARVLKLIGELTVKPAPGPAPTVIAAHLVPEPDPPDITLDPGLGTSDPELGTTEPEEGSNG